MQYHAVAKVEEIPEGRGVSIDVDGRAIAVFNLAGDIFAIDDQCPHMGASLAGGYVENCVVTCPWHGWRFDVRDGTWCDNRRVKIDSFPIRVANGQIYVGIPEKENRNPMPNVEPTSAEVSLNDFQQLIRRMYFEKDVARGVEGTFMWLIEEVGELATALREKDSTNRAEEFADVLAWLATIANVCGIDLAAAVQEKYGSGCPGCRRLVCVCPDSEKP